MILKEVYSELWHSRLQFCILLIQVFLFLFAGYILGCIVHEAGHILLGGGVSTGETLTLSIEGFKGTTRPIDRSVASLLGGYGAVITLSLLFLLVKDWKINLMVLSMITQMLVYALDFNTLYSDSQALVAMGAWWSVPLVVIISMAITIICMARISWLEKIVVANTGKVSKVD